MEPRRSADRLLWIDAARGIAILLVVLWHTYLFLKYAGIAVGPWETINQSLRLVRMPLFFLASGILMASSLRRPWPLLARSKLATWIWLYLLWSFLTVAAFTVLPWNRPDSPSDSPWDLVQVFVWPNTAIWYLYALAFFLALVKLTRRLPALVVVGAAALLSVAAAHWLVIPNFAFDSMTKFFVFFALGARYSDGVRRWSASIRPGKAARICGLGLVVAVAALVSMGKAGITSEDVQSVPLLPLVLSFLACAMGLCLAVVLGAYRIGRPVVAIGRRTLPVFVSHEIVLGTLTALLVSGTQQVPDHVGLVAVPILVVLVISLTLLLERMSAVAPWLYAPPAFLVGDPRKPVR